MVEYPTDRMVRRVKFYSAGGNLLGTAARVPPIADLPACQVIVRANAEGVGDLYDFARDVPGGVIQ